MAHVIRSITAKGATVLPTVVRPGHLEQPLGLAFRLPLVDWFWLCLGVEPNPKVEPRTTPQKRGHRHTATVPPCRKAPGVFDGRLSVVRTRYPGKCGLDG